MWIATKPFRYRGVAYVPGDTVPADKWTTKRFFVARRVIAHLDDPGPMPPPEVSAVADMAMPVNPDLSAMTRSELEDYAFTVGIDDAESYAVYPNKAALIAAIEEALTAPDQTE